MHLSLLAAADGGVHHVAYPRDAMSRHPRPRALTQLAAVSVDRRNGLFRWASMHRDATVAFYLSAATACKALKSDAAGPTALCPLQVYTGNTVWGIEKSVAGDDGPTGL